MSAAAAFPFVTVEEYLRTEYEPHCEYVDGVLIPKSMPGDHHSRFQAFLIGLLLSIRREFGLVICPERHIRIDDYRFRIPDVAVFIGVPDPARSATTPPLFTVEIISPDEPWSVLNSKVDDHLAMGVGTVILADPLQRSVMVASQSELLHRIPSPLQVRIEVPEKGTLTLDFDQLFAELD